MDKFYISNNIRFLTRMEDGAICPSCATHMKWSEAASYVKNHPKYVFYKVRSTSKGNDYVVCTPMKFVGHDRNVVNDINIAKPFNSVDAAYEYLDIIKDSIDEDICLVIDEKFYRKNRSSAAKIKDIKRENKIQPFEKMDSSERIIIPQNVKEEVYAKSGGICPICGKSLSKYSYSIDHIVPLSRGGTNTPENLRATHIECNRFKGNFTDREMANISGSIVCNSIYNNPNSKAAALLIRSFVRGVLNANK